MILPLLLLGFGFLFFLTQVPKALAIEYMLVQYLCANLQGRLIGDDGEALLIRKGRLACKSGFGG